MTYSFIRWLARQSQKNARLRALVNSFSRLRSKTRQGGLIFLKDEDLLQTVMRVMQKVPAKSHLHYLQELKDDAAMESRYEAMRLKYNVTKYKNWEHTWLSL